VAVARSKKLVLNKKAKGFIGRPKKKFSGPNAGRTHVGPCCKCFNGRPMPIPSPFSTLACFPAACFSALKWWLAPWAHFATVTGPIKRPLGPFGPFWVLSRPSLHVRTDACFRWGMAVAHNRYKFVTVSLPKRLRNGRFTSQTAVWWFQK
jgi:hypothetical protein